jgi:hypothetical protein
MTALRPTTILERTIAGATISPAHPSTLMVLLYVANGLQQPAQRVAPSNGTPTRDRYIYFKS